MTIAGVNFYEGRSSCSENWFSDN